ncbi:hypothetical protein L5515_000258 [Caenorhabditis briggsae]|uniref:Uncharacterized protein n=2 Tax=Caenorhabditis briggsae TaxID=6238 RepID=A0AAE9J211_CAEBR|nr:hypothetical protein L5515_000258 [Caenorhabditis briggsae]
MMGPNNLGDVNDMLTLCERFPEDITGNVIIDWTKSVAIAGFKSPEDPQNSTSLILDELEKEGVENKELRFFKYEMCYKEIEEEIPKIRRSQHNDFVLHLAPHSMPNTILIETTAFLSGYSNPDKNGKVPKNFKAKMDSEISEWKTRVDCEKIVKALNENFELDGMKFGGLKIEKSDDPGRSIAGFTYYLSLCDDDWATLLVKVPPFEGECTKEAVTNGSSIGRIFEKKQFFKFENCGNPRARMMGVDCLGDVSDMLTMCNRRMLLPDDIKTVAITAFNDPYENSQENPSSEVLDELMSNPGEHIKILSHKIPTTFKAVNKKVPELRRIWPQQVLHLAPHSTPKIIYFEAKAFSDRYSNPDKNGSVPEGNAIKLEEDDDRKVMEPFVDFKSLMDELNEKFGLDGNKFGGLKIEKSENIGRSVEGYLYFLSLREGPMSTLFVRIPPFDGECTKEVVTSVIRELIQILTRIDC